MSVDKTSRQSEATQFVLVGPSGAGLTTALDIFSDFGFMQVGDVAPAAFEKVFLALTERLSAENNAKKTDLVFSLTLAPDDEGDVQTVVSVLAELRKTYPNLNMLVLDAPEEVLVQRYLNSGKVHAYADKGLEEGVCHQKELAQVFKGLKNSFPSSYFSVDTSTHTREELYHKIAKLLSIDTERAPLTVQVKSFGFKHGAPRDAEMVFDVRFLSNPYYIQALRSLTGLDKPVQENIFENPYAEKFVEQWTTLLGSVLPEYHRQGKLRVTIAVGCTGGQHRSVCMAELLASYLQETHPTYTIQVTHREKLRWPERPVNVSAASATCA